MLVLALVLSLPFWEFLPEFAVKGDSVYVTVETRDTVEGWNVYVNYLEGADRMLEVRDDYTWWRRYKKPTKNLSVSFPIVGEGVYEVRLAGWDAEKKSLIASSDCFLRVVRKGDHFVKSLMFVSPPLIALTEDGKGIVYWEMDTPCSSKVFVGGKTAQGVENFGRFHSAYLPVGSDRYTIVCFANGDTVRLGPVWYRVPQGAKPLRIGIMGDTRSSMLHPSCDWRVFGVNGAVVGRMAEEMLRYNLDCVVVCGDLIYGSSDDTLSTLLEYRTWKRYMALLGAHIPVMVVFGNHEAVSPGIREGRRWKGAPPPVCAETFWERQFAMPHNGPPAQKGLPTYNGNVYWFRIGTVLFVVLNSDYFYRNPEGGVRPEQIEWLRSVINTEDYDYAFAFAHEPLYPVGFHYASGSPFPLKDIASILSGKVPALFCGHEHLYARLRIDSKVDAFWNKAIWQVITGGGGAPMTGMADSLPYRENVKSFSIEKHFIVLEVGDEGWSCSVWNLRGKLLDYWEER